MRTADGQVRYGIIGTGMMASSLIDGIVAKGIRAPGQIHCSDISPPAVEAAAKKGYHATASSSPESAPAMGRRWIVVMESVTY